MRSLIRDHTKVSNGHATASETPKTILRQSPITSPAQRNTPPISANTPNTTHCTRSGCLRSQGLMKNHTRPVSARVAAPVRARAVVCALLTRRLGEPPARFFERVEHALLEACGVGVELEHPQEAECGPL